MPTYNAYVVTAESVTDIREAT